MNKLFKKRIIALSCAALLSLSAFAGCQNSETSSVDTSDSEKVETVSKVEYQGIHTYTATVRQNEYIVQNSRTEYQILLPNASTMTKYEKLAASEFVKFFEEATGIKMKIAYEPEEGLSHNATQKFISIGQTKALQSAGLQADFSVLNEDGCRIKTVDNNIYLFSAGAYGSIYAVYDFMQIVFNYDYILEDYYIIDKGVTNVFMRDFDVTDVPDAKTRLPYSSSITSDYEMGIRFRQPYREYIMPVGAYDETTGTYRRVRFHNVEEIFLNGEPEWKATGSKQACFTAHGDSESFDRMLARAIDVFTAALRDYTPEEYPDYTCFTISCEDGGGACMCDSCLEEINRYGTKSASLIKFCNKVMEGVNEWWDKEENKQYKRENFYLLFMAYNEYLEAPCHYDEATGKYVLNSPDLEFRDDVGVYYVTSGDLSYTQSVYSEVNKDGRENAMAWFSVAPVTYLWVNNDYFQYYPLFYDSFDHYTSEGYQFYMSGNPIAMESLRAYGGSSATGFKNLQIYLDSKLMWDSNLDSTQLIEKWFDAAFGDASDKMYAYFQLQRLVMNSIFDKLGILGSKADHLGTLLKRENFPVATLLQMIDLIEEAYEINEAVNKTENYDLYLKIKKNIDYEFLSPAAMLIELYSALEVGPKYNKVLSYLKENEDFYATFERSEGGAMINSIWALK